jgi:endonuclease-3
MVKKPMNKIINVPHLSVIMPIDLIISRLKKRYPPGKFNSRDPFCQLIATVLSQRTRDEVTDRASGKLFSKYGTPAALARADVADIEELIREVGFYRIKAPRVKEIARIISNDYKGKVPDDMESLLLLPGVGRKTANCVLVYGFGKDAIAVDTHVHRISNRLGLVSTKSPEETEIKLREVLPRKHWRHINELLVRFGQDICKPVGPKCRECLIIDMCPSRRKE